MFNDILFGTTVTNVWNTAKSYINPISTDVTLTPDKIDRIEQNRSSEKQSVYRRINFKHLFVLTTLGLFSATKNQMAVSLGLVVLFAESVDAAYPTVANPISTQYVQQDQTWNYDIDLNQVFNDADGDDMLFGGAVVESGPSTSWLTTSPKLIYGRGYRSSSSYVLAADNKAFVLNGASDNGVVIFNITDLREKKLLSIISSVDSEDVIFLKPYLYLCNDYRGLEIYDFTDELNPRLVNTYFTLQNRPRRVAAGPSRIYVNDNLNRIEVLDRSNATHLTFLGNYSTTTTLRHMIVEQNLMYVSGTNFYILNVSDPSAIFLINTQSLSTSITDRFIVKNQVAYLPMKSYGITILNVSNAFNIISLLTNYDPLAGSYYDITLVNSIAYVIDGYPSNNRLIALDLTNKSAPSLINQYLFSDSPQSITAEGSVLFVACGGIGMQILNGTDPINIRVVNEDLPPYYPKQFAIQGDILAVADGQYGVQIFNISQRTNPQFLTKYFVGGTVPIDATDVQFLGSNLYVASDLSEGLTILESSNPQSLVKLGTINLGFYVDTIAVDPSTAYLGDFISGINVIDIRNQSGPVYSTGNYSFVERSQDLDLKNSVLYIAGDGILTVDVSNSSNPILLDHYRNGTAFSVVVVKDNIVFTDREILNGSDPTNLTRLSTVSTAAALYDFFPFGPLTLVADGSAGLGILNTTDLSSVNYLGGNNYLADTAYGVTVVEKYVYLAKQTAGMQIFDLTQMSLKNRLALNTAGNYTIRVSAVNTNNEWISTTFQLQVCVTPCSGLTTTVAIPTSSTTAMTNSPPILQTNYLIMTTGSTMTYPALNINAVDDLTPAANLIFIVSQVSNGHFQTSTDTTPIYSFTRQQLQNREIQFVHDGSNNPPSYQVHVNDGSLNSLPQWAAITFNNNAIPVLMNNQITISTGQTVILNNMNLNATNAGINNSDDLIFTVSDIQHGFFANTTNPNVPITTFTQGDINAGIIQFTHDGSNNYPSYYVSISDGTFNTPLSLVQINFNNNSVPIVLNNQLTISPGQNVIIGIENIDGLDLDNNSNNLIFIITDITGGQFELVNNPGISILQFTQQDIINGNVQFTPDAVDCTNPTSPSYSLQASDGTFRTLLSIASIDYNTYTTTNGCVVTTSSEQDNINLYIGVGVGVAAFATAATVLGIFAVKRKHQRERTEERIEEMDEMAEHAAKYKNQPHIENTEVLTEEGTFSEKTNYMSY